MKGKRIKCLGLAICCMAASLFVSGCGASANDGKIEIEIVQYKPEAANYFKTVEDEFNATHDNIHLKISSPNDAMTILKTRFIREDYPDIIGIGGDINYSYFVDAEILADISDYSGLQNINQGYLDIDEAFLRESIICYESKYGDIWQEEKQQALADALLNYTRNADIDTLE